MKLPGLAKVHILFGPKVEVFSLHVDGSFIVIVNPFAEGVVHRICCPTLARMATLGVLDCCGAMTSVVLVESQ